MDGGPSSSGDRQALQSLHERHVSLQQEHASLQQAHAALQAKHRDSVGSCLVLLDQLKELQGRVDVVDPPPHPGSARAALALRNGGGAVGGGGGPSSGADGIGGLSASLGRGARNEHKPPVLDAKALVAASGGAGVSHSAPPHKPGASPALPHALRIPDGAAGEVSAREWAGGRSGRSDATSSARRVGGASSARKGSSTAAGIGHSARGQATGSARKLGGSRAAGEALSVSGRGSVAHPGSGKSPRAAGASAVGASSGRLSGRAHAPSGPGLLQPLEAAEAVVARDVGARRQQIQQMQQQPPSPDAPSGGVHGRFRGDDDGADGGRGDDDDDDDDDFDDDHSYEDDDEVLYEVDDGQYDDDDFEEEIDEELNPVRHDSRHASSEHGAGGGTGTGYRASPSAQASVERGWALDEEVEAVHEEEHHAGEDEGEEDEDEEDEEEEMLMGYRDEYDEYDEDEDFSQLSAYEVEQLVDKYMQTRKRADELESENEKLTRQLVELAQKAPPETLVIHVSPEMW